MKCALLVLVVFSLAGAGAQRGRSKAPPCLSLGPSVGALSSSSASVWVRAEPRQGGSLFAVEVRERDAEGASWRSGGEPAVLTSATDHTGVVRVGGLAPATTYEYRVLVDGIAQRRHGK